MNDPRHKTIPNLAPTFDPDPATTGDAAPFADGSLAADLPIDNDDGDAAAYERDGA